MEASWSTREEYEIFITVREHDTEIDQQNNQRLHKQHKKSDNYSQMKTELQGSHSEEKAMKNYEYVKHEKHG